MEGDPFDNIKHTAIGISIHALRMEGDNPLIIRIIIVFPISIHALRMEGDHADLLRRCSRLQFLSTPSGWRATVVFVELLRVARKFLSTPSGWRATRGQGF